MTITSRQNATLRRLARLRRRRGDAALLEGPDLLSEALETGLELETVLATPEFLASGAGRALAARLVRPPLEVAAGPLATLADADSPAGVVALAHLPRGGVETLPPPPGVYLFVDRLQTPANLGALARVAEAAGAAGLALAAGSAHPNHPRALRASAGSLLRLPVAVGVSVETLAGALAPPAATFAALVPSGGRPLWGTELPDNLCLMLGAEGPGLSPSARRRADLELSVPMAAPVESLNVAVAAAVVLYELRRRAGGG